MGMPVLVNNTGATVHTPLSTTLTWAHTLNGGMNRFLVVGVYSQGITNRGLISGVTFNGVAMSQVPSTQLNVGTKTAIALYYLAEANLPPAGSYNVSFNTGGNASQIQDQAGWAMCFSNVWQANPYHIQATPYATGTSTTPSASFTSNYSDVVVVDMGVDQGNPTVTAGTGVTMPRSQSGSGASRNIGAWKLGDVGTTTVPFTLSASAAWGMVGLALRGTPGRNLQILNSW